ncbi:MAG: IS200/IS605 family transposase [Actinobacteria bacterium]|nr:IS200/IS605 family transposase [Actinomycetota bacterium]
MRFRKSTHTIYNTQYHIVWTPRYRRKILIKGVKEYLEKLFSNMEGLDEDIEVRKVNVREDHVHIVMVIPPRVSVANTVKYLKSVSGAKLKDKFDFMKKAIYARGGIWSRGYCVSTVGLNEKAIMDYVEYQYKEDTGQLELELGE